MRRKPLPKIPSEVITSFGIIEVKYVNKLPDPTNKEEYTAGLYSDEPGKLMISIIRREPRSEKWVIFFHELIHSLEAESKIQLTEKEVNALSLTLFGCFMRNDWKLPGEK